MVLKISIIGTNQSGSTRLFNLVRLIYICHGKSVKSGWKLKHLENSNVDVIINKIHNCNFEYTNKFDILLLPIRNVIDCYISAHKRFPEKFNKKNKIKYCHNEIDIFYQYRDTVDMIFKYESYSINLINKLCNILEVELPLQKIIKIMKDLDSMLNSKKIVKDDNMKNKNYRETLLSQSHNTSNGQTEKFIKYSLGFTMDFLNDSKINHFLKENDYI
jgi:hypothetical protein